jgi:release factor glutamine methyltransferase
LPHILGEWAFYGRNFKVTPDVLIPRPETELLVERALVIRARHDHPLVADVGTGSGILAVTLSAECPEATFVATDRSRAALAIARQNAARHGVSQIHFVQTDLLQALTGPFDLICANLPYIPTGTLNELPVARWEPRQALDGGPDGLMLIRKLLSQAQRRLAPGGVILLEIEASTGKPALAAARDAFPDAECILHRDLASKDRLVEIHKSK